MGRDVSLFIPVGVDLHPPLLHPHAGVHGRGGEENGHRGQHGRAERRGKAQAGDEDAPFRDLARALDMPVLAVADLVEQYHSSKP